jgi:periplasmic divalent cation tolerance protein
VTQNDKPEIGVQPRAGHDVGQAAHDKPVFVYATFPSLIDAEIIAGALVDAALAACVNILPDMISIYRWEGARHRDAEVVAIVKTTTARVQDVVGEIRARHSYSNPAIAVLPVEGGSEPFLAWIAEQTRSRS